MRRIRAVLLDRGVIVPDVESARTLYRSGFYGKFIGHEKVKLQEVENIVAPLQLSLVEALYLVEKGVIEVYRPDGSPVSVEELREIGRRLIRNFDFIYRIYRELRERGLVVKSGLKFGALFAVYEKGPGIDHAPMLVHFIEPDRDINALDITRAARLSHSVNKRFVLATWNKIENRVDYVAFEWWTP
ncbi:MAG: tRNA-intron lyase [Crenarchaeota archaeon]|nr:tRNA-intron lyase [Thermoproteota archaeon]